MKSLRNSIFVRERYVPAIGCAKNCFALLIAVIVIVGVLHGMMHVFASPVITEESWSDTFDDSLGIVSSYNVNVDNGDVKLDGYRNKFEEETLGQIPIKWIKEIPGGSGNRFRIVDHYYEPGQAIWIRVNDDASAYNQQKVYIEYLEYFSNFEFELTTHAISPNTARQGYFYIEFFDDTDTEYHEVRYYWDDARSGTPSSSASLTAIDLGYTLQTGTSLGIKYFINENISEDIDSNPNVDLITLLGSVSKVRYGFYADAGGGWDHWEQVVIDNIGIYNDNIGDLKSTKLTLPFGYGWTSLEISKTESNANCYVNVSILDGETDILVPGFDGINISQLDVTSIDPFSYPTLKLYGNLEGTGNATPILHEWTVLWEDILPPEIPKGLKVSNPWTGYSLILSWYSNNESDLAYYSIYYSSDNTTFSWLTDVSAGTISFIHYGLSIGETYYYKISAADHAGNPSLNSSIIFGIPDIDTDGDGVGNIADEDDDGDTVVDENDTFPLNPSDWMDSDSDGIGNNADFDDDGDGFYDTNDAFPLNKSESSDLDGDGIGDNTDEDMDGDGINNTSDDFPKNILEWKDTDLDGMGDNSDIDIDGDGIDNFNDAFPYDSDEWRDLDGDGIGDNVDLDMDGDGVENVNDAFPENIFEWEDSDSDGIGDNKDMDDDEDGHPDVNDVFPYDDSEWADLDGDGLGDNIDNDIDGDGINNSIDDFPTNVLEWMDMDIDGYGDNSDTDIDGDGIDNFNDAFPYESKEWGDLDDDGIGDNGDLDRDGDGVDNVNDTHPNNIFEWEDTDSDGIGDNYDFDDDGDGYLDVNDLFSKDNTEWRDLDKDGIGDNSDEDKDGDGVGNNADMFPTIFHEWVDFDSDGIGDNGDLDDDNDGHTDLNDDYPYDSLKWKRPNELIPLLYILILLAIIILVAIFFVYAKMGKLHKTMDARPKEERSYHHETEQIDEEKDIQDYPANDFGYEIIEDNIDKPEKKIDQGNSVFPPPPPPPE
jgi:hypothetical protein